GVALVHGTAAKTCAGASPCDCGPGMRAFNLTVRRTLGISLALSTLLASCQLSPSVSTARPQAAVQVFLWGNPDTTDRDLKLAKDGGFAWVKQLFEWRNIEKAGKGQFE